MKCVACLLSFSDRSDHHLFLRTPSAMIAKTTRSVMTFSVMIPAASFLIISTTIPVIYRHKNTTRKH